MSELGKKADESNELEPNTPSGSANRSALKSSIEFLYRYGIHFIGKVEPSGTVEFLNKEHESYLQRKRHEALEIAILTLADRISELETSFFGFQEYPDTIATFLDVALSPGQSRRKIQLFCDCLLNGIQEQQTEDSLSFLIRQLKDLSELQVRILALIEAFHRDVAIVRKWTHQPNRDLAIKWLEVHELSAALRLSEAELFLPLNDLISRGLVSKQAMLNPESHILPTTRLYLPDAIRELIPFIENFS